MKLFCLFITCALLLTGCGPQSGARLDAADEQDARVRKGLELVRQKNWDSAVKQFETALEKKPSLGRPDLELAIIYQQKKNYARAIYHYERYLEKRPNTEKLELIQDWIKQAKVLLAGEVSGDISGELTRLTRENNMLRKQLEMFQGKTAAPSVTTVKTILTEAPVVTQKTVQAVAPAPEPVKPVEPVKSAPTTYTVRPGDTLSQIARTVYNDTAKWKQIYEANKDQMQNENDLKAGQTLVIPDR